MKCQRFLSIPVFSVFLLMGSIYYATIFIFIEDWIGLQSSAGTMNALIFTLMASLCLFSFFVCVLTDPGHVPSSYLPDVEGNGVSDQESISNSSQLRQCDKCCTYKPPRAHHCRICRRCVLRMDHHCLWIVSEVMMVALSGTLGTLLVWHMYLITHNMTTIEYYEGIRAAWLARKSGQSYRHPFDLSIYKNITSVMGPNMLKWLCPTAVSHLKDGMNYPTSHDN